MYITRVNEQVELECASSTNDRLSVPQINIMIMIMLINSLC